MKRELIAKHEKDSRACRDAFALTLKDMMAADSGAEDENEEMEDLGNENEE